MKREEVVLALLRTGESLTAPVADVLRGADLSLSQYNVLRILRGAGKDGLPCGEISARMIRRDPDLTRLLDRLEKRGLVERARGTADRRVVTATITDQGLKLLESLDEPVEASMKRATSHMPAARLRELMEILDELRGT
jgi:DNA-binding MarR family transcriptional regulator